MVCLLIRLFDRIADGISYLQAKTYALNKDKK